ncbi:MAG: hypothetical protein M1524_03670 [Patescibacteria group bacterium]|nr:hypothetical protein [Patescibacteria group bacterium]
MYPIYFLFLAFITTVIHLIISKQKRTFVYITQTLLMYLLFFCVGLQGIFAWFGHTFMGNKLAQELGWPTGNPFQFEVGMANLGEGIAGVMTLFWKKRAWLMIGIFYLIFIYGAAYGHIIQLQKGNTSPYNSGVFLYIGDIAIPTLILILLIIYYLKVVRGEK